MTLQKEQITQEILQEILKEERMKKRYNELETELSKLSEEINNHYSPIVDALIKERAFRPAFRTILEIPCHVTKCFMLDKLRQAGYDTSEYRKTA